MPEELIVFDFKINDHFDEFLKELQKKLYESLLVPAEYIPAQEKKPKRLSMTVHEIEEKKRFFKDLGFEMMQQNFSYILLRWGEEIGRLGCNASWGDIFEFYENWMKTTKLTHKFTLEI